MNDPADARKTDLEQYVPSLEEARAIKGVSLSRDAWRRLHKSRLAMLSLWFLVVLGVLSILTPLLPLQPPRHVDTSRQFAAPEAWPLMQQALPLGGDNIRQDRIDILSGDKAGERQEFF